MKKAKTKQIYVLQGYYSLGWEDLMEYDRDQLKECKQDLKDYDENERTAHRIIKRRVAND